jgi:hypothetical protein
VIADALSARDDATDNSAIATTENPVLQNPTSNQPAMLIQDEDAHFEFDNQIDAPVPPNAPSEPTETPSDDASQADRSLLEPATSVSEDQLAKTDEERLNWLNRELREMVGKRRNYKAEVKDLEKRIATANNGSTYCEPKQFFWADN